MTPPSAGAGTGTADGSRVPAGRAVRRATAATARRRSDAGIGQLLGDLYYALIMVAIGIGMALGVVEVARDALRPAPVVPAPGPDLGLPSLAGLAVLGFVGVVLSLAGRLGPVGVGAAEATWWLPLPVDRRGLLRPTAARLPLLAGGVGALVLVLVDLTVQGYGGTSADRLVRFGALGGLGTAALVLLAGVGQSLGAVRRRIAAAGHASVALVPVLAVVGALTGWRLEALPSPGAVVLAVLTVVVVAAAVALDRRLGRIPGRDLRESGSISSQAVGAVVSLDSRELGRTLVEGAARPRRRRSARFGAVRSASAAVVAADVALLVRSPRHVVQVLGATVAPAVVLVVPELASTAVLAIVLVGSGYVAMLAGAEGARRAEMAPVLDRLLPLSARRVRVLRTAVPGAVAVVWSLGAFAAVAQLHGDLADGGAEGLMAWLALGLASAPVWAGAAVRSAYRPAPDWAGPLVSTPAGAVPLGVLAVLSRGPDVVALGLVPVLIALLLGAAPVPVLVAQGVASAIVVAVCVRLPATAAGGAGAGAGGAR
ncbi:DUF6297 family protein [Cellulomonas fimi]|uniref:ABC-2 type transport system permease protein n=1 Tax=Cellulomonas fimi TaxID=1708 RepID=A0A7Y0QIB7_CELFI|nr:DUF6297 family protein [Cellulomonas fimi]NMR21180.1 hypothetical protein [Cellulomonas fimi]